MLQFTGLYSKDFQDKHLRPELMDTIAEFGTYTHHDCDAWTNTTPEEELLEVLEGTDVLLTAWGTPRLPLSYLERPDRRLKYICNVTGTVKSWIPREYVEAGIIVTNWGRLGVWELAEGNVALIFALLKEVPLMRRHMAEAAEWKYEWRSGAPTLRRRTVGYVGFGATAEFLHGMLRPFEVETIIYDPWATELPEDAARVETLDEIFEQSDVVTIQCGLTDQTEGMVGADLLRRMKKDALLINTARGKIIREAELIQFLRERPDVGAGLDVFEAEPMPADSPLRTMDNVICYPHSIGAGRDSDRGVQLSAQAARNIRAFCTGGELDAVITPKRYDLIT